MSSTTLFRLSGGSLSFGSFLVILGVIPTFFLSDSSTNPLTATAALVRVLGGMLIVLGLPGMYVRQAKRTHFLGLLGFLFTFLYVLILGVAGDTINAFIIPFLAQASPALLKGSLPSGLEAFFIAGQLLALAGGLLLGIATLRAAVFSRWASLLLISGGVLGFLGNFLLPIIGTVGVVLLLGGLVWLGIGTWTSRQATVQPEPRVDAVRV